MLPPWTGGRGVFSTAACAQAERGGISDCSAGMASCRHRRNTEECEDTIFEIFRATCSGKLPRRSRAARGATLFAVNPVQSNPNILGGTPCFAGTRVPVASLFDYLQQNYTIQYFLSQFPTVAREQVDAVLEPAKDQLSPPPAGVAP